MKKQRICCAVLAGLMLLLCLTPLSVLAETQPLTPDPDWPTRTDGTRPTGDAQDPFLIEDAADLLAFRAKRTDKTVGANNYKGKVIAITADIDLNPGWNAAALSAPDVLWGEFYEFSGTLEGGGHTIRGLYHSGSVYVGFIRNGTDCIIRNLTVDNSAFLASGTVCGLVATLKGTSTLNGVGIGSGVTVKGKSSVGGLVGNAYTGSGHSLINCTSSGTVLATDSNAGGLFGDTYQGSDLLFENCLFHGTVQAGGSHAGGIIGNISKKTELRNCAADGSVTAADFAGGLIGRNAGAVTATDCLSCGTLTADHAAGLLGLCRGKVTLTRCVSVAAGTSLYAEFLTEQTASETDATAEKTLTDCYGLSQNGILWLVGSAVSPTENESILYDGAEAEQFVALTSRGELPKSPAFGPNETGYFGWTVHNGCVMPMVVRDLLTAHTFETVTHPATCLDYNSTDYHCTTCGYSYTEIGHEKSAHTDADDWIYDPAPTETAGGKRYRICDVCESLYDIEYVPVEGAVYEPTPDWGKDSTTLYTISSASDLMAFAAKRTAYASYRNARVILTADIDLNPGWDPSSGLRPTNVLTYLFEFCGILDGQGHTISGLYMEGNPQNNNAYACLISKLTDAVVCNLKITNSLFRTEANYAGLFGTAQGRVTLEDLYVDITVESAKYAGGILAQVSTDSAVTLNRAVFAGSVAAKQYAGGLIGWDAGQTVALTDCANYGTVQATDGICGGLIGQVSGSAALLRCFSAGSVSGSERVSGLVTANKPRHLTLSDCYADAALSEHPMIAGTFSTDPTYLYGSDPADALRTVTGSAEIPGLLHDWTVTQANGLAIPAALLCFADGHNYEFTVTPPTCASRGFTTGVCTTCGRSTVTDYTEPVEHTPSAEWIIDSPATETRMGSRHLTCSVCGDTLKQEIIPKLKPQETETPPTETGTEPTEAPASGSCKSRIDTFTIYLLIPLLWIGTARRKAAHRSKKIARRVP